MESNEGREGPVVHDVVYLEMRESVLMIVWRSMFHKLERLLLITSLILP